VVIIIIRSGVLGAGIAKYAKENPERSKVAGDAVARWLLGLMKRVMK
jgi:hypothetical protein